jgi:hypothetical protein
MDNATVKALAKETFAKARFNKPIELKSEEVILTDGSVFNPMPVKNSSDLLRATLLMMFKHVADIHVVVVQVIAEKFGLDINDIEKAITEDPRWTQMLMNPIITDLTTTAMENSSPPPKKRGRPSKKVAAAKPPPPKKVSPPAPPAAPAAAPKKPTILIDDDEVLVFN